MGGFSRDAPLLTMTVQDRPIAVSAPVDDVVRLLCELLDVQRRMLAVLERPPRAPQLTRQDRAVLARLLPVLGATFGSEPFSSRDALEDDTSALRLVTTGMSAKSIGRLLARGDGLAIDGLMVRRQGAECRATL